MPGRPGTLPWNFATFSGNEPVTTLSDNFSFLNNQINDSGAGFTTYAADTGTVNNLIITLASAPVAYEAGMMICVTPSFTNSGPSVINVNALGNIPIVTASNVALAGGEIVVSTLLSMVYDGTSFRIISISSPQLVSSTYFGTVPASQTVDTKGALLVSIELDITAAFNPTITMNNVVFGSQIQFYGENQNSLLRLFGFVANTPGGVAYNWRVKNNNGGAITQNAGSVVLSIAANTAFGFSFQAYNSGGPTMRGVYSNP